MLTISSGGKLKPSINNGDVPIAYELNNPFPNPFNPSIQIGFALPEAGFVSLKIYDILGRAVSTIAEGPYQPGFHSVTWDGSKTASGIYTARFVALDEFSAVKYSNTKKLVLAK